MGRLVLERFEIGHKTVDPDHLGLATRLNNRARG